MLVPQDQEDVPPRGHESRDEVPRPSQGPELEPTMQHDGSHLDPPRGLHSVDPLTGQLYPVSQQRPTRDSPATPPSGEGLEGGERASEAPSGLSDADSNGPDDSTLFQLLHQAHRRSLHAGQSGLELVASSGLDALLDVGPHSGEAHSFTDAAAAEPPGGGTETHGPSKRHESDRECHRIQLHGKPEGKGRDLSLALASAHEERSADGPLALSMSSQCMASCGWQTQTTGATEEPTGAGSPRCHDGPELPLTAGAFNRHAMIQVLLTTSFGNESNWCFLNSGMMCFLWSLLHRRSCDLGDFGKAASVCETLMNQPGGQAVQLAMMTTLRPLLQRTTETGPRDCAEFIAELLEWCNCSKVDMSWARRVSMADKVVCEETGGKHQPLALDGMYELDKTSPTISDLCQMWTHGHGMRAAFLQAQSIKCIFADRLMSLTRHLGHFHPIDMHSMVELPHFYGPGLDLHWSPYRVQAVICHLGSSLSGHFRAVLRYDEHWQDLKRHHPVRVL